MIIKFNPTGTRVTRKGFAKVRFDLYPSSAEPDLFAIYNVDVPDEPMPATSSMAKLEKWWQTAKKKKQLNPCYCHSIVVPETFTLDALRDYLTATFSPARIKALGDILIMPKSEHFLVPLLKTIAPFSTAKVVSADIADLKATIGSKLLDLTIPLTLGDEGLTLLPQSITMGTWDGVTDLGSQTELAYTGETELEVNSTANAAGTIEVCKVQLRSWASNGLNGRFGVVNGTSPNFTAADWEDVGTVTKGAVQTFNVTIAVTLGDLIAFYADGTSGAAPYIIIKTTGGGNVGIFAGQGLDGASHAYSIQSNWAEAVLGTGTESGGGWANIAKVNGVTSSAIKSVNSVLVASIAKINGVAV